MSLGSLHVRWERNHLTLYSWQLFNEKMEKKSCNQTSIVLNVWKTTRNDQALPKMWVVPLSSWMKRCLAPLGTSSTLMTPTPKNFQITITLLQYFNKHKNVIQETKLFLINTIKHGRSICVILLNCKACFVFVIWR